MLVAHLPVQWISWNHTYVLDRSREVRSDRTSGQFLYALKGTAYGDRQVVLEGQSRRGVIAVVDFAGHNRKNGPIYYAWGAITYLREPVGLSAIDADSLLSSTFANRQGGRSDSRRKRLAAWRSSRADCRRGDRQVSLRRMPSWTSGSAAGDARQSFWSTTRSKPRSASGAASGSGSHHSGAIG